MVHHKYAYLIDYLAKSLFDISRELIASQLLFFGPRISRISKLFYSFFKNGKAV